MDPPRVDALRASLTAWYRAAHRSMPWRNPPPTATQPLVRPDPWAVWVSEVMLQQTRVQSAIPYFERFMARFPSPLSLALTPEAELLSLWAGLGYYARARNLRAAAQQIVDDYAGQIPAEPALFRALKGVGPYTAGAVLSIAFGQPLAAVDGNVERVLCRVLALRGDPKSAALQRTVRAWAHALAQRPADALDEPGTVNQALMELGATLCTPRSPQCEICPVRDLCAAHAQDLTAQIPAPKPRPVQSEHSVIAALVRDAQGAILLHKPRSGGLLGGLYTLPLVELGDTSPSDPAQILSALRLRPLGDAPLAQVRHTFTHKIWHVRLWQAQGPGPEGAQFFALAQLDRLGLGGPTLKALRAAGFALAHRRGAGPRTPTVNPEVPPRP